MKISHLLSASLLLVTVLAGVISSFPGSEPAIDLRTLDEQYALAQNETGDLVVLWGGDALAQGAPTIAAWEARFPRIKLNLTVDVSKYHDSRVDREFQMSGSDGADVAFLQTLQDFDRWKRQGRLLPYKPATWDSIYPNVKDPDGAFVGAFLGQFGSMIYDQNLVNISQVPTTFNELLDPIWKDKLVLVYPHDDDAVAYLFSLIIGRYGWSWFESLTRQNVRWVRGTGTPAALLNAGNSTSALSFTTNLINSTHLAQGPTSDPHVMWPQTGAIFATSPRPESAKLFMNWIMSDEYQSTVVAASGLPFTRTGVNATVPGSNVWADQSVALTQFGKFEVNREIVEQWRFQFETTLGTAQGPSPLHLGI
ncbi:hypothetical protein G647_03747 [Cladophialophora carrionii CBS 160.54]|uniref:Uncharacterized protein n=1 Tax=Cladophialophora carrionii CBS 160.54 TaxID=1279043 RepID=V9DDJ2_9EURO|nr:uncharacterized protein G647_03747 [Cladophialophora carrionii CBS 160.54]ETI24378.1 hypothetical protein G647_03747 [Cladophialophora carrionii CBS 160.54]